MTIKRLTKLTLDVDLSKHIDTGPAGDAYPRGSRVSVKHIAYLYAYCGKTAREIRSRYPVQLTDAHVHLALTHYFLNKAAFDAQIAKDCEFNSRDSLSRIGSLPIAGPEARKEAEELERMPPIERSTLVKF